MHKPEAFLRAEWRAGTESRRGVVFIKEIVPRAAIALVARVLYNENYVALPMSHRVGRAGGSGGGRLYGPAFAEALGKPPASAFLADGAAVTVFRGVRLAS